MEDIQIIELYWKRDASAIQETKIKYGKICFQIANHVIGVKEDAEECENDTYWTAWKQIPPTRPQYLAAYLCRIVRNLALKRMEYIHAKKRTPDVCVAFEELEDVIPDDRIAPDRELDDIGRIISEFLHTEKKMARRIFMRRYFFCDTISEIAWRYGMQENTVKSVLFRTRNRLHTYLKKEGILS